MGALTEDMPKPMLSVAGKTLIEHKLEILPNDIDEVIIVVGYLGSVVHNHFGGVYKDKRILYVEQENPIGGTADALWQAAPVLHDRFLVLNGDDLYGRDDIIRCTTHPDDWVFLVEETEDTSTKGKVVLDGQGHVTGIQEGGTHEGGPGLLNTGACVLDTRIFEHPQVPKVPGSPEMGLPQTALVAAREVPVAIYTVAAHGWFPITVPEDLARAEEFLKKEA